jgi:AraC family transcriptional activator of mtrCDE
MRMLPIERVLKSALGATQLCVEILSDVRYCGSWYDAEPQTARGQFHLIGEGECLVKGPMLEQPVRLAAGDLAIFPHGTPHVLCAVPPAPGESATEANYTSMLCGEMDFSGGMKNPVLRALPPCLVVHSRDGGEAFRHLALLLLQAARDDRLGQRIFMNKLADSLFTLAVCEYALSRQNPAGFFAALTDLRLARVLEAIHTDSGRNWTLPQLAAVAGMSRSAFALHFGETLGIPPMQYLTQWRVLQAKELLRDRRLSVAAVAEKLGYKSETGFRKLFKRIEGVGPGLIRRSARRGQAAAGEAGAEDG